MNKVVMEDAIIFMKEIENIPKLILTDPPYGINYKTNIPGDFRWNKNGITSAEKDGRKGKFDVLKNDCNGCIDFESFFSLCFNKMKEGFLFVFSGWQSYPKWSAIIDGVGFELKTPIFWNKKCANGGDLKDPLISVVEIIIRAKKGTPMSYPLYNDDGIIKQRVVNIWNYGRTPKKEQCGHPTQKPIRLCEQLIRMSTKEGEYVVDPFCGSGATLIAAQRLRRKFDGCDIDEEYVKLSNKNLRKELCLDIMTRQ